MRTYYIDVVGTPIDLGDLLEVNGRVMEVTGELDFQDKFGAVFTVTDEENNVAPLWQHFKKAKVIKKMNKPITEYKVSDDLPTEEHDSQIKGISHFTELNTEFAINELPGTVLNHPSVMSTVKELLEKEGDGELFNPHRLRLGDELSMLQSICHKMMLVNGFYDNCNHDFPEYAKRIALIHSELSEALEGLRKPEAAHSDKIDRANIVEELADIVIRTFDFAGFLHIDLASAIMDKILFNASRPYKHNKTF